jgi:hypothetical protein
LAIKINELNSSIIVLMEDHRNGLGAESGNIVSIAWLTGAVANRAGGLGPSGSSGGGNGAGMFSDIPNQPSYPQADDRGKLHTRCTLRCDQKMTDS